MYKKYIVNYTSGAALMLLLAGCVSQAGYGYPGTVAPSAVPEVSQNLRQITAQEMYSEHRCRSGNWYQIGQEDAQIGQPVGNMANYVARCRVFGVNPNLNEYRQGHASAIGQYCSLENAYMLGLRGAGYYGACPRAIETEFLRAYDRGAAERRGITPETTYYPSGTYPSRTYPTSNYPSSTYPSGTAYPSGTYPSGTYPSGTYSYPRFSPGAAGTSYRYNRNWLGGNVVPFWKVF